MKKKNVFAVVSVILFASVSLLLSTTNADQSGDPTFTGTWELSYENGNTAWMELESTGDSIRGVYYEGSGHEFQLKGTVTKSGEVSLTFDESQGLVFVSAETHERHSARRNISGKMLSAGASMQCIDTYTDITSGELLVELHFTATRK